MTKLIGVLILVVVIWGGYELFVMWDRYDTDRDLKEKAAEAAKNFNPDQLPGMPYELQKSLDIARKRGATGFARA